jgi:hypothetical protein
VRRSPASGRGVPADIGLAAALAAAVYFVFGTLNLNPADEGFLWYGVLQTRAGEIPIRDFQSYDPGRYYWCAGWSFLFGEGILGLRASIAVMQAVGLFFGLRVCRRAVQNPVGLGICGGVLTAWMFPIHKIFEPAIAMAAVWVGVRLLEAPSSRRIFEAGALVGLAAWFGRNHGLYTGLAIGSMIGLLLWKGRIQSLRQMMTSLVLGGMAGSAPLWIMLLGIPGFAAALRDAIIFNLTTAVNLPLPYAWPWLFDYSRRDALLLLTNVCTAIAFALPFVLYPLGLIVILRTRPEQLAQRAAIVAATFVGIFYMHHASVRSDVGHLAQVIHPLLILLFVISARWSEQVAVRLPIFIVIGAWALVVTLNFNPLYMELRPVPRVTFVAHDVSGDVLRLPSAQAAELTNIEAVIRSHVASDERLFVAPTRPVFYPIFGKKSPTRSLYFLFPASEVAQQETIERLEAAGVKWALILDEAIDGRDDLRFQNSNALVWAYLTRSFVRVEQSRLPPNYSLLRRRTP